MLHDNDSQLVVTLDYQLDNKEHAFMITKTLFIRCYTIKCDQILDSLQHKIICCMIALTNYSISQSNIKLTNIY